MNTVAHSTYKGLLPYFKAPRSLLFDLHVNHNKTTEVRPVGVRMQSASVKTPIQITRQKPVQP